MASSFGDNISVGDYSFNGDNLFSTQQSAEEFSRSDPNDTVIERKTVEALADTLLRGKFFLTALEFHAELQDAGLDLPKLRQFFSNPANVDQKTKFERSLCRSPSQQTIDSIEFDRMSEVNNSEQDRVAVLEYELRKAKETIKRLRENVTTIQTSSETEQTEDSAATVQPIKLVGEEVNIAPAKPMEVLERRALDFLVHEYVSKNGNKMTAITFSEENTNQDFDDWDDVGLNTARPPCLLQLYRRFLHYRPSLASQPPPVSKQDAETSTNDFKHSESMEKLKNESLERKIDELEERLRKSKHDSEREISRLMFENERTNEELKKLKKAAALAVTGGFGGPLCTDVSAYSLASTTGPNDEGDQVTLQPEESVCLKVKAEPCQHIPRALVTKIFDMSDHRVRAPSEQLGVFEELEKLKSSFSPYDCTLSWEFYRSVKKCIAMDKLEGVVPFLVWLMLRTTGDQREDITQELLSLFGAHCEMRQVKMIVAALLCYADLANVQEVQSHLLAVCWEQINDRDISRRLVVALLCGPLACYLEPQIRSSLLFSILTQLLEEDKDATVRLAAIDSLVNVLLYLDDYDKLVHLNELYVSIVNKDSNDKMIQRAQTVYLPVLLLWSSPKVASFLQLFHMILNQIQLSSTSFPVQSSESFHRSLIGLYHSLPVLVHRCLVSVQATSSSAKDSWHADPVKLPRLESELFEWSILEPDQTKLKKLLERLDCYVSDAIESATGDGVENVVSTISELNLPPPLAAVCEELFPLLIKLSTSVSFSAKAELSILIRTTCFLAESLGPTVCTSLMAPLFIQQSTGGKLGTALVSTENGLAQTGFVAVYCAFLGCCPAPLCDEIAPVLLDCIVALSTSRCDLAPILTAFSMLAPLSQLQLLLTVVWDCVVHSLPSVRCSAACLAEHMIGLVDATVLSSRLFSALVTLSNDPQLSVRLATLGPLVALLTHTENVQLLEKVYFQLQQVLDEPQCANDTGAHLRTIELFTQIIPNVDAKFRDDFILQRFAVMAAQNNHCQDKMARQAIAEALLNAYNTTNCCYIPESTVRRLIIPALKCLAVDFQQLGLKVDEDNLAVLTKEVESKLPAGHHGHASLTQQNSGTSAFSLPVPYPSSSSKNRTASSGSITSNASTNILSPSIMSSQAAEAAKSKLAKLKQQVFHK